MPILDQGSLPLCWNYAGVQLAEAWRRSHSGKGAIGNNAFVYAPDKLRGNVGDSGATVDYAWELLSHASCSDLSSSVDGKEFKQVGSMFDAVETRASEVHSSSRKNDPSFGNYKKAVTDLSDLMCQNGVDVLKGLGFSSIKDLTEYFKTQPTLRSFEEKVCGNLKRNDEVFPSLESTSQAVKAINDGLNQDNPQPVAISLCGSFLQKGPAYGEIEVRRVSWSISRQCSDDSEHAVIVIGRRPNPKTNRCEYLIRNSWGTNWCRSSPWECDAKGQVWVDGEELDQHADQAYYVDHPKTPEPTVPSTPMNAFAQRCQASLKSDNWLLAACSTVSSENSAKAVEASGGSISYDAVKTLSQSTGYTARCVGSIHASGRFLSDDYASACLSITGENAIKAVEASGGLISDDAIKILSQSNSYTARCVGSIHSAGRFFSDDYASACLSITGENAIKAVEASGGYIFDDAIMSLSSSNPSTANCIANYRNSNPFISKGLTEKCLNQ
jgi:hypothetical protein